MGILLVFGGHWGEGIYLLMSGAKWNYFWGYLLQTWWPGAQVFKLEKVAVGTLSFMAFRMNITCLFLPSVQFPKMMCLQGALPGPPEMSLLSGQGSLTAQSCTPLGTGTLIPPASPLPPTLIAAACYLQLSPSLLQVHPSPCASCASHSLLA